MVVVDALSIAITEGADTIQSGRFSLPLGEPLHTRRVTNSKRRGRRLTRSPLDSSRSDLVQTTSHGRCSRWPCRSHRYSTRTVGIPMESETPARRQVSPCSWSSSQARLSRISAAPSWLRDLGLTSWLVVGMANDRSIGPSCPSRNSGACWARPPRHRRTTARCEVPSRSSLDVQRCQSARAPAAGQSRRAAKSRATGRARRQRRDAWETTSFRPHGPPASA